MVKKHSKAKIFSGKQKDEYYIWMLCDNCAKSYMVPNSPLVLMGEIDLNEIVHCDSCKRNLITKQEYDERDTNPDITVNKIGLSFVMLKNIFNYYT